MVEIVPPDLTVDAIYQWSVQRYKDAQSKRKQSSSLRCSSLGEQCSRKLWYYSKGFEPESEIDGRVSRLFERGDLEERRFTEALTGIGVKVWGDQSEVSLLGGVLRGHIDGLGLGFPESPDEVHLLEFKTHNNSNFKLLKQFGVEKAHFKHYMQVQMYMGGLELKRAFYLAVNKDTDELYQERIKFNPEFFKANLLRAERIVSLITEPPRTNENKAFYLCKMCQFRERCHEIRITDLSK